MKFKQCLILVVTAATIVLFGILLYIPLTGCNGGPTCCPKSEMVSLYAMPEYVCDPNICSGQNSTQLYAVIKYVDNNSGQPCVPINFKYPELWDYTNNVKINIQWNPPPATYPLGLYQGTISQTVQKDTWYALTAFGCNNPVIKKYQVNIVHKAPHDYSFTLCTSKCKDPQIGLLGATWVFPSEVGKYGKGIVVDSINNPATTKYQVTVEYGGFKKVIIPGQTLMAPFHGLEAGYEWKLSVNGTDASDYQKDRTSNDFCLTVYLTCECIK